MKKINGKIPMLKFQLDQLKFSKCIDKIIIAPLLGFVILGNFAFAIQIYTILMVVSSVSYKYLVPEDATGKKNKQLKKINI